MNSPRIISDRRGPLAEGIDEALIERVVRGFYDKVRADDLIGPVFDSVVEDWEPHLLTMMDFWSSVLMMTGRYHGRPMPKHMRLPIGREHFVRWLSLFEATVREECDGEAADLFVDRAHRIANSLLLGLSYSPSSHGPSGP
ncbi:MAG: preprotein translocase [Maricaulis sp.]|jgi:hemoglobin|nr:preprotein translocase [Maricaulis sp.]HAQ36663.1 preprotein translocase [Alphaproteobacteria bacterium]|tara:strand:+ start:102 stop:524 length:423 start_codon:yes stop_codon:yes gene_type:complete